MPHSRLFAARSCIAVEVVIGLSIDERQWQETDADALRGDFKIRKKSYICNAIRPNEPLLTGTRPGPPRGNTAVGALKREIEIVLLTGRAMLVWSNDTKGQAR